MAAITHSSEVPDDETPPLGDHPSDPPESDPAGQDPESLASQVQASTTSEGLRLIGRYVRMQPLSFGLSLVGGVSWALLVVGVTYVLGAITDEVIDPAFDGGVETSKVWLAVVALVLVAMLRGLSVVVRRWFGSVTEARSQASLRRDVSDRLLEMPMSAYRRHPTGQLLANADVDITTGTQLLMPLPFSIGVIALLAVSLVSLYLSDPVFALVALVLFPLLTILSRVYTNRVNGPASEVQARLGEVSSIAHESFDGALVVKTLGREHDEDVRFQAASDRLRTERLVVANMTSIFQPLIDLLPNLGMIVLLLAGAWRIDQGDATAGQLVQAVALFGWLAFPMRIVGFMFESMPRSVVSVRRVDRLLAEAADPAERGDHTPAGALPPGPLSIEFDDVSFSYGDTAVLEGVTFEARPGETIALVGSTGSGKSTLANLLVRLDVADSGVIRVGGVPIGDVDTVELRSAVSLAFQESFLFATTIAQNVDLGRGVDDSELYDALDRARAARFVAALPAAGDTVVGERGVTLSGGQRQRVALARSLAGRPRVLVLDDATSAVDPVIEAEILGGLRSGSTTMLVVAHRLSTILLADRIVHLEDGRVRGQGSHTELLADPEYAALVTAYESDERNDHDACFVDDEIAER